MQGYFVSLKGGRENIGRKNLITKIKSYVISCSSDADLDVRRLYVWGEMGLAKWLPDTIKEANRRIRLCQKENGCDHCDAQVHEVVINRTRPTKKQSLTASKSAYKKQLQEQKV